MIRKYGNACELSTTQQETTDLDILRIDHLWMMTRLTVLSLANNLIEKIENLDALVNLKILNLSFNKLTKIENLENLVNLVEFGVFRNMIPVLEGIETMTQLEILSVGENLIEGEDCIMYLRKFENLRCVNMVGNPCTKEEDFMLKMITFVPQLLYYDYETVTPEERQEGQTKYRYELRQLEEVDDLAKEKAEKERLLSDRKEYLTKAFVYGLEGDQLFDTMIGEDPDGQTFRLIGDKVLESFTALKSLMAAACLDLFEFGQEALNLREEEVKEFVDAIEERKREADAEARQFTEVIVDMREGLVREASVIINEPDKTAGITDYGIERMNEMMEEFEEYCHQSWLCLVHRSIQIYELMDDMRGLLAQEVGAIVNQFTEKARECFTKIREGEADFFEAMSDKTNRYLTTFHMRGTNFSSLPPPLKSVMSSKDALMNALGTSHEVHLRVIDFTEDRVLSWCSDWFKDLLENFAREENERNRGVIYEVTTQFEFLKRLLRQDLEPYMLEATTLVEGERLLQFIEQTKPGEKGRKTVEETIEPAVESPQTIRQRQIKAIKDRAKTVYPQQDQTEPYEFYYNC